MVQVAFGVSESSDVSNSGPDMHQKQYEIVRWPGFFVEFVHGHYLSVWFLVSIWTKVAFRCSGTGETARW